ncbi:MULTISPECIES: CCC motif membrane protein [Polaribacter]|uniref:CCC motif membrane protein n=1 Tax=Polaribacter sejongensis TaxID=985043 RepID=A0AAJ1QW11_9FLAO|nr:MULTISPECIES: CCC motif membrane protein [Polaribacter]AUC22723.1 hypothetical protein BTO15_11760 [Polaribacter sejongensis]MDN3619010.1 CCC motif membrane protein [Polaribacter undariae]UWD33097.1 CCC motif membrane protein [Polaribacter undariae]
MEKQNLPNATTSLVLGILSLVTCICYGIIGLPLGIIALVLGNKAIKEYNLNPENYNSVGNATAGKITGIIGIILNAIFLLVIVWFFYQIGLATLEDPALLEQRINEIFGQ